MDIDKEIAEKVMEWKEDCDPEPHHPHYYLGTDGKIIATIKHRPYEWFEWHPSTDIKQAFEVVEKMREMGWEFYLEDPDRNNEKKGWYAEFLHHKSYDRNYGWSDDADTPAMAICKAALTAINYPCLTSIR
jgi:hypothetical protein